MDRQYIQLNLPNTISVFVMVMAGYLLIALLVHAVFYIAGRPMDTP